MCDKFQYPSNRMIKHLWYFTIMINMRYIMIAMCNTLTKHLRWIIITINMWYIAIMTKAYVAKRINVQYVTKMIFLRYRNNDKCAICHSKGESLICYNKYISEIYRNNDKRAICDDKDKCAICYSNDISAINPNNDKYVICYSNYIFATFLHKDTCPT